ncbi:hypothetical protein llg_26830 [Luteolibacter sp. LG18]|nr:hypothetical protein llg_26830 [Luteolibacter sp. LG18]
MSGQDSGAEGQEEKEPKQPSSSGLRTLDSGLWTLDSGLWTLDSGFWILDSGFPLAKPSTPRHIPRGTHPSLRLGFRAWNSVLSHLMFRPFTLAAFTTPRR